MKKSILIIIFVTHLASADTGKELSSNNYNQAITLLGSGFGYSTTNGFMYSLGLNYERRLFERFSLGGGGSFDGGRDNFISFGPQAFMTYHFTNYNQKGFHLGSILLSKFRKYDTDYESGANAAGSVLKKRKTFMVVYGGYKWKFGLRKNIFFSLNLAYNVLEKSSDNPLGIFLDLGYRF